MRRVAASQGKEADDAGVKVHLGAQQAVRPLRVHEETMTEEFDGAVVCGAAQVDDLAAQRRLEIQAPILWEEASWRCGFDACGRPSPMGFDVAFGGGLEVGQGVVVEACPYLGLFGGRDTNSLSSGRRG
jgi:hypothetical protein